MRDTIIWQRVEGALIFASFLIIWWQTPDVAPIWAVIVLFFSPDLSFAAYAVGAKFGAFVYNLVHNYGVAVMALVLGLVTDIAWLYVLGLVWLGHAGFDRMLGYGLKSRAGFQMTHLGRIGTAKSRPEP